MKITKKLVKDYWKKYGGSKYVFMNMLQSKAVFCIMNEKRVYAFNGLKNAHDFEKMMIIADNMEV